MFDSVMDIFIFIFGMASTIFTSVMNMPLAWKVFKTKNTTSLSIVTLFLTLTACLIWVIYAILMIIDGYVISFNNPLLASLPILISNGILTFLMWYMITIKMRNDRKEKLLLANIENVPPSTVTKTSVKKTAVKKPAATAKKKTSAKKTSTSK